MELNWQEMIFQFLGGLGLFLFAIKYMGDGLQKAAGDRLRDLLDRFTTNPFMGVLVGIFVTVLIQSSSGTTVITVGLVSAGFMTLRQAIGVIMGANIGTTVTAFIIGINIGEYAYPIMALGAVLLFFFKKSKIQNIGQVLFGFSGLFIGLELMSSGMKPLRDWPAFIDLTLNMSDSPILGVIVGAIFTLIVQSSSATVGILQGLYAENLITLHGALPVLFGDNIGTTITAILAALGASVAARRAAATHVLFNVFGSIIFLLVLGLFTNYIEWISGILGLEPKMQIAFAHGTFNVANTLIQLPLIGVWAYVVTKLIPGEDTIVEYKPKYLDYSLITKSPGIALGQAKQEVVRMGGFGVQGLSAAMDYLKTLDVKQASTAAQLEEAINNLDQKTTDYLVSLSKQSLSGVNSHIHHALLENIRDIERVGDHVENLIELIDYKESNRIKLSQEATQELEGMFELVIETVKIAMHALDTRDVSLAQRVRAQEERIDEMERSLRKHHIRRLNEGICSGSAGIVFADIISNLERIGDHANNIADTIYEQD
ncbi:MULTISPECIES: Na/Pi cotransporter family protein [unclassified Viridibacillus]|uniref:Na/Pi cotransporter family protein n=1 Tax=unclassified Viridibacillus TaxID=2617942 RepID=UPI00096F492A|nr:MULTISPECIES: Na/Pi cotransporter family protein [unclassified Viridibacillus]OMC78449.1 sodium-dependent phosphate transporter [Viridibacillus sp. FSL H8-0123]OMC82736.1 sodium-dependent phosphate transporter [Viridibacillus sp. FSL H7-0596]